MHASHTKGVIYFAKIAWSYKKTTSERGRSFTIYCCLYTMPCWDILMFPLVFLSLVFICKQKQQGIILCFSDIISICWQYDQQLPWRNSWRPRHYECNYKHSHQELLCKYCDIHYHLLCKYTQKDDITQTCLFWGTFLAPMTSHKNIKRQTTTTRRYFWVVPLATRLTNTIVVFAY